jgi:hypothetical protein
MAGVAVTDKTLALAGVEVRHALDWFDLSPDDRLKVLAAKMARITVETPVQDKWPAPAQAAVILVSGYILAARRKQAVAKATPHGSVLNWLRGRV